MMGGIRAYQKSIKAHCKVTVCVCISNIISGMIVLIMGIQKITTLFGWLDVTFFEKQRGNG